MTYELWLINYGNIWKWFQDSSYHMVRWNIKENNSNRKSANVTEKKTFDRTESSVLSIEHEKRSILSQKDNKKIHSQHKSDFFSDFIKLEFFQRPKVILFWRPCETQSSEFYRTSWPKFDQPAYKTMLYFRVNYSLNTCKQVLMNLY